jgi:hypothetical protein
MKAAMFPNLTELDTVVLTYMATVGVQYRDSDHLVLYAAAALDTARQAGSGAGPRQDRCLC